MIKNINYKRDTMKAANLISIVNAYNTLPDDTFQSYLKYFSIKLKKGELNDLEFLNKFIIY